MKLPRSTARWPRALTCAAVLVLATFTAPTANAVAHTTPTSVVVHSFVPRQHVCPLYMSLDRPNPCLGGQLSG